MRLARIVALALLAIALPSLALPGCAHVPNPGQVVVTCAMDAVNDPAIRRAVLDALTQENWRLALTQVALTLAGGASEVIACILHSYLGQFGADPASAKQFARARAYLTEHGYTP
jgi:hypothetical protein